MAAQKITEATAPAAGSGGEDSTTTATTTSTTTTPTSTEKDKPTTTSKPRRAPARHRIHELSSQSPNYSSAEEAARFKKPTVRFDESTIVAAASTKQKNNDSSSRQKNDPRKIYMGKLSHTQACLYFSIPVIVIGLLLFLTADFENKGNNNSNTTSSRKPASAKITLTNLMQQKVKEAMSRRRIDPCALFLHPGSIPNTGWSYFAGQAYQKGDLIFEEQQQQRQFSQSQLLTLTLTTTTGNDDKDDDGLEDSIRVPPYALVLKHHPTLANADGTLYLPSNSKNQEEEVDSSLWRPLRATRYIEAGEEIFVPYHAMLHRHSPTFDHIPTISDYAIADGIIADMITTSRRTAPRSRKTSATQANAAVSFPLVKRSVAIFHPRVAALLPDRIPLHNYNTNESSAWARLNNQTRTALQQSPTAVCVGDVVPRVLDDKNLDGGTTSTTTSWTVRRNLKKGSVIGTVPVHVQPTETRNVCAAVPDKESTGDAPQECRSATTPIHCFGDESLAVRFCPLTHVSFLPRTSETASTSANDSTRYNVEYQWRERKMQRLSLQELLVGATHDLAWNLVALEDLTAGQEVSGMYCTAYNRSKTHLFSLYIYIGYL